MDWSEKRRQERIELGTEKPLTVHVMSEGPNDTAVTLVASVRNVSVRGCSLFFEKPADCSRLKAGQIVVISLLVDGFSIPLKVEVVRLEGENGAAIRFKPPFPRELEKLEKFLEPRSLGLSLREIDQAKLQMNQQKGLRWFQGMNDTNLFSWSDPADGSVVQQQLVFLDHVVEWAGEAPARTGVVRPDERAMQGDVAWIKAELLDFDPLTDPSVLSQARVVLESSQIDAAVKQSFLKKLL